LLLELSDSPYLLSFKSIEAEIAEKRQQQSLLALNKQEMDEEMQDLTRSKTQVECLVADLRSAEVSNDGAAEQLQNQLQDISQRISEKEVELMEIEPEWASARQQEMDERRKYAEMLVFAHGTDCSVGSKTLIPAYKHCTLSKVGLRNFHHVQNVTHSYVVKSTHSANFEKTNPQLSIIFSLSRTRQPPNNKNWCTERKSCKQSFTSAKNGSVTLTRRFRLSNNNMQTYLSNGSEYHFES
jgi:hypothetical protein